VGGIPVFADIENEECLTISPASIEKCITEKTRAIIIMHYAGYSCDLPAIMQIAQKYNLSIIEDSAHAIGSELNGQKLGTWGQVGCFSFFSNKNMTTGEGGMVITNDDTLAEKLRILRSHGMTSLSWDRHKGHAWTYDVVDLGYNYRIDEIRSAIGRVQLKKVTGFNQRRESLTQLYCELLDELAPEILVPFQTPRGTSCHHIMPVLLPEGTNRFEFMEGMKSQGVQTSIHYPPIHHFKNYEEQTQCPRSDLFVTENVGLREITLPLYPTMKDEDVEFVVTAIQNQIAKLK
jgi:dTDP-4-amino-4,6-dideoxygalactose transaminase